MNQWVSVDSAEFSGITADPQTGANASELLVTALQLDLKLIDMLRLLRQLGGGQGQGLP